VPGGGFARHIYKAECDQQQLGERKTMDKHNQHHDLIERRLRSLEHWKKHRRENEGEPGTEDNREGFEYGVTLSSLLTTASNTQVIQIDALSAFELEQITGYAEPAGATFPLADSSVPQLSLQITDGAENRQLFQIAMPWGNVVGTARFPFVLARSRIFNPNQAVNVTITNFSAVTYNNIFIALVGQKIYFEKQR
jgi:hypothetical protein